MTWRVSIGSVTVDEGQTHKVWLPAVRFDITVRNSEVHVRHEQGTAIFYARRGAECQFRMPDGKRFAVAVSGEVSGHYWFEVSTIGAAPSIRQWRAAGARSLELLRRLAEL